MDHALRGVVQVRLELGEGLVGGVDVRAVDAASAEARSGR